MSTVPAAGLRHLLTASIPLADEQVIAVGSFIFIDDSKVSERARPEPPSPALSAMQPSSNSRWARIASAAAPELLTRKEEQAMDTAAQSIEGEVAEADEPNLLPPEDMDIYGEHPAEEPLRLVTCKACGRVLVASRFMEHQRVCSASSNRANDSAAATTLGAAAEDEAHGQTSQATQMKKGKRKAGAAGPASAAGALLTQWMEGGSNAGGPSPTELQAGKAHVKRFPAAKVGDIGKAESPSTELPGAGFPRKKVKFTGNPYDPPSVEELDYVCGVLTHTAGTYCRRHVMPLTCKFHPDEAKEAIPNRRYPFRTLLRALLASKSAGQSPGMQSGTGFSKAATYGPAKNHFEDPTDTHEMGLALALVNNVYCLRRYRMRALVGGLYQDGCAAMEAVKQTPAPATTAASGGVANDAPHAFSPDAAAVKPVPAAATSLPEPKPAASTAAGVEVAKRKKPGKTLLGRKAASLAQQQQQQQVQQLLVQPPSPAVSTPSSHPSPMIMMSPDIKHARKIQLLQQKQAAKDLRQQKKDEVKQQRAEMKQQKLQEKEKAAAERQEKKQQKKKEQAQKNRLKRQAAAAAAAAPAPAVAPAMLLPSSASSPQLLGSAQAKQPTVAGAKPQFQPAPAVPAGNRPTVTIVKAPGLTEASPSANSSFAL
eukprot:jgi/Chlat1/4516/Chrsp29S04445